MLNVWIRELAGWVLLGIGLAAFAVCYVVLLLNGRMIEAAALTMIGIIIFRGGLQLLKVAMAARAAQEAYRSTAADRLPLTNMRSSNGPRR